MFKRAELPNLYWVDLFCGAGGTSTGIHLAGSKVLACVNHDANAIKSHLENHPQAIHFTEDIKDFAVVVKLKNLIDELRINEPEAIIAIWASLECTNFSKAKGGQARDGDSRTLAHHMFMYLEQLQPNYFWVENVREFMSWGPLCKNGKPISRSEGVDYINWINDVNSYGFKSDFKLLNSADFGAYQSRERLFIQFAQSGFPIAWPEQTHTKDRKDSALFPMPKWKAVREVLDLDDEGESIFTRKKPLSDNTLKRIYAGLVKFVANGHDVFTKRYNGGSVNPQQKVNSIDKPIGTICTNGTHAIVTASHLNTYYGNGGVHSIDNPSPTLTTKDRVAKVDVNFLDQQYSSSEPIGIDQPCNTLTTVPKFSLVKAKPWIMDTSFNNVGRSIDEPSATVLACHKYPYLVNADKFILNPSWGGNNGSVDRPCCTVVARQDKAPLYIVSTSMGELQIPVYDSDSETMILIKEFMVQYGIYDIKMRMLNIPELKQIQGFPKDYKLIGNQTEQKKYIGNAVEVNQAKAIVEAKLSSLKNHFESSINIL